MSEQEDRTRERTWTLVSMGIVAAMLVFSLIVGLVILPLAQAPNAHLDPWTAICRAVGLKPGTPAQPQPSFDAKAAPVSQVEWTPKTLGILASADVRPGAALAAAVCSNCHGEDGMTNSDDFPRLAGQSPFAIFKQLSDYRTGARYSSQMTPVAQKLSSDQLAEIAAYFGQIHRGVALGKAAFAGEADLARLIYRGDPARRIPPCEGCHARGVGGPPDAPVIQGQNAAYIERQLMAYRSGQRRNDVYQRMRDISARLRVDEIKRIAEAYQGAY